MNQKQSLIPDLTNRVNIPELMDFKDSNLKKLINTIKQFKLINYLFTSSRYLIQKYIIRDILAKPNHSSTFLDIGAGACDIPIWLLKKMIKKKINVHIFCLDYDERIINYSKKICKEFKNITIIQDNVYNLENYENFDYIFANHFLHHLEDEQITRLLQILVKKTNRIFLLNDILRSYTSYILYSVFSFVFLHNSFAYYDGRLSIRKGFLYNDLSDIISHYKQNSEKETKKMTNISVFQCKPGRIGLIGEKIHSSKKI